MKFRRFRIFVLLLLTGCLPVAALCNETNPPWTKILKNLKGTAAAKNLKQVSPSKLQQAVSRAAAASKLEYIPQQPEIDMPFLTCTFQARVTDTGKDLANCFSGTVFQVEYEGK